MTRTALLAASLALACALPLSASEPPHSVWVKAKCALCHGDDGSSNTPAGKQTKAPDLRTAAVQKRTDADLAAAISAGHAKMPSFKSPLSTEQIAALVSYIRALAPKK